MRISQRFGARHDVRMVKRRGHRGDGTVYWSKADHRWIARYPLGVVDGRRIAKRVKCRTQDEADDELADLRRLYGAGGTPSSQTVDDYLEAWFVGHARSIRASTRRSYRGHIDNHISPLLGGILLRKLAPRDVRRLVTELERKHLSAATIHLVIATLRIALNAAKDDRAIVDNPADGIRLPRVEREPVPALTPADVDRIVDAVADHWAEPIVRLLLGSGLRLGEATELNQGDAFLDERYVRLRKSKTTIRAVPISDDAVAAIRLAIARAPREGPDEPIFFGVRVNRAGHRDRLRGDAVSAAFPRLMAAAGLPRLTPHGLRHAVPTIMVAAGVPMRAVADQLGHRNPALTARVYAHVHFDTLREAVRTLEQGRRAR